MSQWKALAFQIKTPAGLVPSPLEGQWAVQICEPKGQFLCGRAQVVAHFKENNIGIPAEKLAECFANAINSGNLT